jgi:hypothetical protein
MAGSGAPETPTMKLSDTQGLILGQASRHEQGLAAAPKTLPAAARNAVFRSMLKNGLLAECAAPRECLGLAWREDADGARIALRITDAGLRAIGVDRAREAKPRRARGRTSRPTRPKSRRRRPASPPPRIGPLRRPGPRRASRARARSGRSCSRCCAGPEGATVAQIAEATGWAPHTVRGFFAGLKKRGVAVAVLERVRQVGRNKEGAKGSYTVYRIAH